MINKNNLINALENYIEILRNCTDKELESILDNFPNPYDYEIVNEDDPEFLRWNTEMAIVNGCGSPKQEKLYKLRCLVKDLYKEINQLKDTE